jgi:uncharacterized protein
MRAQGVREKVAIVVQGFPAIVLVYLFGSQAEGVTGPASDLDLGILLDRPAETPAERAHLRHELCRLCRTDKIDVVWLQEAPIELAFAIISRGILLYEREAASRVEFEARVMGLYGDYLPVLRVQRADLLRGDKHDHRIQWHREALGRTLRALGEIRAAQDQKQE